MQQALEGIRIVEFAQLQQASQGTQKLADMGAEVIKVEPHWGDIMRGVARDGRKLNNVTPMFLAINRNKRSISIDLKSEEGFDVARELVESADVLVENYRPGVMGRLGLSYEEVHEYNPEIIYVSASGYGSDGPYVEYPGQDLLIQAMSGFAMNTGRRDEPPTPVGLTVVDALSASNIALHIMIALYHREFTGEGQHLETSLLNAAIDAQPLEFATVLNTDIPDDRPEEATAGPYSAEPYGVYETTDGYIVMVDVNNQFKNYFDLDFPPCETEREQFENRAEIHRVIETYTRKRSTSELLDELRAEDFWVAEVKTNREAAEDLQVENNEMIVEMEHPKAGTFETTGFPVKMSGTPGELHQYPPSLGEHSQEILTELGYDEESIAKLLESDVIRTDGE